MYYLCCVLSHQQNAVIAHGVAARLARGVASSTYASTVAQLPPRMLELAQHHLALHRAALAASNSSIDSSTSSGNSERKIKAILFDVGGKSSVQHNFQS
jgi:hypothetical protein